LVLVFEELNGSFVPHGTLAAIKRAEISPFTRDGIATARIDPIFSGFEFLNHGWPFSSQLPFAPRPTVPLRCVSMHFDELVAK
jgi:hypothetical protein